jgi:hypothetical protein
MEAHALAARTSPDPANIEEGRGFKVNPPCFSLVTVCMMDPYPAFSGTGWLICRKLRDSSRILYEYHKDKKSQRIHKAVEGFSYYFFFMIEGSGARSIRPTNRSGS